MRRDAVTVLYQYRDRLGFYRNQTQRFSLVCGHETNGASNLSNLFSGER
jgi:hypothetical protein